MTSHELKETLILDSHNNINPLSEHEEQVRFVRWLDWIMEYKKTKILYFAIPNGGDRNIVVAGKLKAEGVRKGVPDIAIVLDEGKILWIEMKKSNGGKLSNDQKEFHRQLEMRSHIVNVAHGAREAAEIVKSEMGWK